MVQFIKGYECKLPTFIDICSLFVSSSFGKTFYRKRLTMSEL